MRPITSKDLDKIDGRLSPRDHAILTDLDRTQVLTGVQLQRLHFTHIDTRSRARDRRRVLQRLGDLGLVSTVDRRVGGSQAGSAGHVYTLTSVGRSLLGGHHQQPATGEHRRSPGAPFLTHALAISEIYVRLMEASRDHDFHVARFTAEPICHTHHDRPLKPDAYLVLHTATHRDCWWLEIDQATESLPRIKRKCRTYLEFLAYGGLGPDGVPPRILYTTPNIQRCEAIKNVITQLSTQDNHLIGVITHADASKFLITELLTTQ
jgi:hypothetical protein